MDPREIDWEEMDEINLAHDGNMWLAVVNTTMKLHSSINFFKIS